MLSHEINFDGLVGPTHSYAGLSYGNLASTQNRSAVSNPREAALQGLAKMKFLADKGLKQAVLPPHERPDMLALRQLGFSGCDAEVLEKVHREHPVLLAACSSASAMWAANAATVSPSADTADGKVHFTPANLVSQFHRSLESRTTANILRAIFPDESHFTHHPPLPLSAHFGDEGAANHTRLAPQHGAPGIEVFVYGRSALSTGDAVPAKFPARQTRDASEAIARLHGLAPSQTLFIRQNPAAIDAGAFHNDVVAVGNQNVILYHELAYAESASTMRELQQRYQTLCGRPLFAIEVKNSHVSIADAVRSYLFNSQLVTMPDGSMALICPTESLETLSSKLFLEQLISADTPIKNVHYVDVRQSMRNGGGPACLRLRVALTDTEVARVNASVLMTPALYETLTGWVRRHYRDHLTPDNLADVELLEECKTALDELTQILGLGSIYPFQIL